MHAFLPCTPRRAGGSQRSRLPDGRRAAAPAALAVAVAMAFGRTAAGQAAYPMVMSVSPTALQVGTSGTVTIASRYALDGASAVLVSGAGVRGGVAPEQATAEAHAPAATSAATAPAAPAAKPKPRESLPIVLHAEADAVPGVRDVRLLTPLGVSTVGQLLVVRDPVVVEAAPAAAQRDAAEPRPLQEVPVPSAVCGTLAKAEEVDRYRFRVEAGESLGFNVWCMRLEDRVHDLQTHADPILVVRDGRGAVVVSSDNTFHGDPAVWHTFTDAGPHTLEIRDVRYLGNVHWTYCIEISRRPIVRTVFPPAVAADAIPALMPLGPGAAAEATARLADGCAPPGVGLREVLLASDAGGRWLQPLLVVDGHVAIEPAATDGPEPATPIAVPVVIDGRLDRSGAVDRHAFDATKGQRFDVEVFASRLGSSVDAHLRILDAKGTQLAIADDMTIGRRRLPDATIEGWTAPADGRYLVEVRDLHLRGGETFVYALQIREARPWFELFADTDKTLIAPGTTGVLFVRAVRHAGFNGGIQLSVAGMPDGVTASCGRILPDKGQDGCIVFTATADARPVAAPITILGTGRQTGDPAAPELSVSPVVYQETYLPGGGRGHWPVESHVVAVSAPADIRRVAVGETAIRLKPGESRAIDVEVERAEGFATNVLLEATCMHLGTIFGNPLPEGVAVDAAKSETLLTGGKTKGTIVLVAAPTAPETPEQQFAIMANVSVNFVMKRTYGSPPLTITIAK